jgi:uncharacterized repeat protein (TIGR03833 family)
MPMSSDHTRRANIWPGMTVFVVLKQDQRTGKLTRGIVRDILTSSASHPRGIKVRLQNGLVGRVQQIPDADAESRPD